MKIMAIIKKNKLIVFVAAAYGILLLASPDQALQ